MHPGFFFSGPFFPDARRIDAADRRRYDHEHKFAAQPSLPGATAPVRIAVRMLAAHRHMGRVPVQQIFKSPRKRAVNNIAARRLRVAPRSYN
jgi:hypothetical protein